MSVVPVADPGRRVRRERAGLVRAIEEVLDGGRYILGERVREFEEAFARAAGASHCVGVASGTDAISVSLRALGIEPDDEVVTPSFTAVATVAAIERVGARPVLADVERGSRCLDAGAVEAAISPRTRAIVAVHLYGHPAPMDALLDLARRRDLAVVGDCAQALGATHDGAAVGTLGHASAFSFYPTKNLGAVGDAGAVVTSDPEVAERARAIRQYGWRDRFVSREPGWNTRLDEIQAAALLVLMGGLAEDDRRRREIAERYARALAAAAGVEAPATAAGCRHAWHLYVVDCGRREELRKFLAARGIATDIHYPLAVHQQPAYAARLRGADRLPVTEALCQRVLTLPFFAELTDLEVERVAEALEAWREAVA